MTHTPGPWTVSFEVAISDWALVIARDGKIVANVNSETGPDLPPLVSTKMPQAANARLIAAAPELLVAPKGMLDIYDRYTGVGLPEASAARAIIAKIERETT